MPLLTTRRVAFASAVVAAAVGAYFAFRPTQQPTAAAPEQPAALLRVEPRLPGLLPGGTAMAPADADTYRKTVAALVKSEFVSNAALRDPKVRGLDVVHKPDAAAWLAEHVTADYGDGSSVLRIRVEGMPSKEAALLANAVAAAFLTEVVQKDVQTQRELLRKLEDTRAELTRSLDTRKQALNQLASGAGVPPNAADHRALIASLYQERAGLRVELAKVRMEKDAEREKRMLEELAGLDARIKSCEQADLDTARTEVASLETVVSSVAAEHTRVQIDMNSPPRVTLLALATSPD